MNVESPPNPLRQDLWTDLEQFRRAQISRLLSPDTGLGGRVITSPAANVWPVRGAAGRRKPSLDEMETRPIRER